MQSQHNQPNYRSRANQTGSPAEHEPPDSIGRPNFQLIQPTAIGLRILPGLTACSSSQALDDTRLYAPVGDHGPKRRRQRHLLVECSPGRRTAALAEELPGRNPSATDAGGPEGQRYPKHSVEASAELLAAQTFPPKRARSLPPESRGANSPPREIHGPLPENHERPIGRVRATQDFILRTRRVLQHPNLSFDSPQSQIGQGPAAHQTLHRLVL